MKIVVAHVYWITLFHRGGTPDCFKIGLEGSLNPYVYAGNNPVMNVDPSGLMVPLALQDMGNAYVNNGHLNQAINNFDRTLKSNWLFNYDWINSTKGGAVTPVYPEFWFAGGGSVIKWGATGVKEAAVSANAIANSTKIVMPEFSYGIGATGKVGESFLQTLGGQSQVYFATSKGGRYVDQLVGGVAHESKVGYTTLKSSVQKQIAKDSELLMKRDVKGVTWNFFTSPVTGRGGASTPLQQALERAGIKVVIHK